VRVEQDFHSLPPGLLYGDDILDVTGIYCVGALGLVRAVRRQLSHQLARGRIEKDLAAFIGQRLDRIFRGGNLRGFKQTGERGQYERQAKHPADGNTGGIKNVLK